MKIAGILVLAAAAVVAAPRPFAAAAQDLGAEGGVRPLAPPAAGSLPLRRGADPAPPRAASPGGAAHGESPARPSVPVAHLTAWLREPDLDRREEHFNAVVERAVADPALREDLAELARGTDTELAWTARLALREVRQRPAPLAPRAGAAPDRALDAPAPLRRWPFGGRDPFDDPFFRPFFGESPFGEFPFPGFGPGAAPGDASDPAQPFGDPFARLRTELERLDALLGGGAFGPSEDGAQHDPEPGRPQGSPRARFSGRSQSLSVTPEGVRLEVEDDGPDGRTSHTYTAKTLEELYRAHPELRPGGR